MAVFKKMFSATKNKAKNQPFRYEEEHEGGMANTSQQAELESCKNQWQEELASMSDFLTLKSTAEQVEDGVDVVVDTCCIEDQDGMPVLKAIFDAHYFQADDIDIRVQDWELIVEAQNTETRENRMYTKTMVRRLKLPSHVDPKMMHSHLNRKGILTVEMPFHLPPQRRPHGPNVFPILFDSDGHRKIRLMTEIGSEFSSDDVTLETNGRTLHVLAAYNADVGKYAHQMNMRELRREFTLPDNVHIDHVRWSLAPDGRLHIEIVLQDDPSYKCQVSVEPVEETEEDQIGEYQTE